MFHVAMFTRHSFTAELSRPSSSPQQLFVLGEAAIPAHFWPGRGLDTGLKGALSLARTIVRWAARRFPAELTRHVALMHALQYREVDARALPIAQANRAG